MPLSPNHHPSLSSSCSRSATQACVSDEVDTNLDCDVCKSKARKKLKARKFYAIFLFFLF